MAGENLSVLHSHQDSVKEILASKVHLRPATWHTGKLPSRRIVQTSLASLGVVQGQN